MSMNHSPSVQHPIQPFPSRPNTGSVPSWAPRRTGSAASNASSSARGGSVQRVMSPASPALHQRNSNNMSHPNTSFNYMRNNVVDSNLSSSGAVVDDTSVSVMARGDDTNNQAYSKSTLLQMYQELFANNLLGHNPLPSDHLHVIADHPTGPLALEPLTTVEQEILQSGNIFPETKKYDPNSRGARSGRGGTTGFRLRRTVDRSGSLPPTTPTTPSQGSNNIIDLNVNDDPGVGEIQGSLVDSSGFKLSVSKSPIVRSSAASCGGTDTNSHAGSVSSDVWSTAATGVANGDQAMSDVASVAWSRRSRSRSPSVHNSRGSNANQVSYGPERTATPSGAPPGLSGLTTPINMPIPSHLGQQPLETWTLVEWYYRDPSNTVQGPFTAEQMQEWYTSQYFGTDLLVKATFRSNLGVTADSGPFCKLIEFASTFCRGELVTPFITARYSPANTPLDLSSLVQPPFNGMNQMRSVTERATGSTPNLYDPFASSSPSLAALRDGNPAVAGGAINSSMDGYGTTGVHNFNASAGVGSFSGIPPYTALDNVNTTATTMGHYNPPEYSSTGAWSQYSVFGSQPNVSASITGGAWGLSLPGPSNVNTTSRAGFDPTYNANSGTVPAWTSYPSPGVGGPCPAATSSGSISAVDRRSQINPDPNMPLSGAKSVIETVKEELVHPQSRSQSPAAKHIAPVEENPIRAPSRSDQELSHQSRNKVASSCVSTTEGDNIIHSVTQRISDLVTDDNDATWPVQHTVEHNGTLKKSSNPPERTTGKMSVTGNKNKSYQSNEPSVEVTPVTSPIHDREESKSLSVKEFWSNEQPSLSAWGAKEDAAAADVWETASLPAINAWSNICTSSGTTKSSSTSSPVASTHGFYPTTDSTAAKTMVPSRPAPVVVETSWAKKSASSVPKLTEIIKQEVSRKSSKRDTTLRSGKKVSVLPMSAENVTVMAWGTPTVALAKSKHSPSDVGNESPTSAWKLAGGSTKSFAEIQAEEAQRESQRQKRKVLEQERAMAAILEAEKAKSRTKNSSNIGSVWGDVSPVTPVPIKAQVTTPSVPLNKQNTTTSSGSVTTANSLTPTSDGSWVTVRGGIKTVKPASSISVVTNTSTSTSNVVNASSVTTSTSASIARTVAVAPSVTNPKVTAANSKKGLTEETAKWASNALKKIPGVAQVVPSLLAMFAEFAVKDDVASDTVNTVASLILDLSTAVDSRAFAAEFVKRRRVDVGLTPTWTVAVKSPASLGKSPASAKANGGGGGKSVDTGFQVVSKKKKGGKRN